ncbi:site-specific integrase [Maribellus mangrovi]|uniref:site-specific integrase n=1 Tax=Maribellus mangrovi TaxID=3133146 RepID=UPI0030EEB66C
MQFDLSILFFIKRGKVDKSSRAPIYCRITVNGERAELSINEKAEPNKWDVAAQRVKGRSEIVRSINDHIEIIESKIKAHFNKCVDENEHITARLLKDMLSGIKQKKYFLIQVFEENNKLVELEKGSKYVKATVSRYSTCLIRLKDFINSSYAVADIDLEKLDLNFIRRFEIYLRTEYKLGDNGTMNYLKRLKKVIHFAMGLGYIGRDPFAQYKTAYTEVNRGYLTQQELKSIEDKIFRIKRLDQVRDVFVFVCYTGLSYSDLKKLTPSSISLGIDGKNWIIYEREKTGVRASIPILPPAQQIIDKYANDPECVADNKLLPVKSNQKLNSYLSEIAELCEIDKHVTMHLGRHTFATTVTLTNGVPIETVQKMLGHKNLSTTQIYSRVVDTKISNDMLNLADKLSQPAEQKKLKVDNI